MKGERGDVSRVITRGAPRSAIWVAMIACFRAALRCDRVSSRYFNIINRNFSTQNAEQTHNLSEGDGLYETHIRTTAFQKALLSLGSTIMAITDPSRDDMVAVLGETTGFQALKNIRQRMLNDEEGRQILIDKPRINSNTINLEHLRTLPNTSLAGEYLKFLDTNGVSPDTRLPVQFVDDSELAYVMQRYREVHDLIHTVLAMPTNMLGEVAVKWVEAIQFGLPMCYMAAIMGPIRFKTKQRAQYSASYLPWAIKCAQTCTFLMNIYYEKHWEEPIEQLRNRLHIKLMKKPSITAAAL